MIAVLLVTGRSIHVGNAYFTELGHTSMGAVTQFLSLLPPLHTRVFIIVGIFPAACPAGAIRGRCGFYMNFLSPYEDRVLDFFGGGGRGL